MNPVSSQSDSSPPAKTLVFEKIKTTDQITKNSSFIENGNVNNHILQRAGRPYTYVNSNEPYIYDKSFTMETNPDGEIERKLRIWKLPNNHPQPDAPINWAPPEVEPEVISQVQSINAQQTKDGTELQYLDLHLKIRGMPRLSIPLHPRTDLLDNNQILQAKNERKQYIQNRKILFLQTANQLIQDIENNGGFITREHPLSGWLTVKTPSNYVPNLYVRTDLKNIESVKAIKENCDQNCRSNIDFHGWALGNGKQAKLIGLNKFIDSGYDGIISNPSRHNHGRMMVSIVERDEIWDEACFLQDTYPCTGNNSRLLKKFACDDKNWDIWPFTYHWDCYQTSNFSNRDCSGEGDDSHEIAVTSIIGGDYIQSQGYGKELGDYCFDGGTHCYVHSSGEPDWKQMATGMAPETYMSFFGNFNSNGDLAWAYQKSSYDDEFDVKADIMNLTNTTVDKNCDPYDVKFDGEELENAFDDGVFITIASGNGGNISNTSCQMDHPADVLKTFTVASLNSEDFTYCRNNYQACAVRYGSSLRGGAQFRTTYYQGNTITLVDLIAPGYTYYNSTCENFDLYTGVNTHFYDQSGGDNGISGSSFAAPHVAGAAVHVKHWLLEEMGSLANDPGLLHTVMLAMGDRYSEANSTNDSSNEYVTTYVTNDIGGDVRSGFGRLKTRLLKSGEGLDPVGYALYSHTFTNNSSTEPWIPFDYPIPSGANFLKCVSFTAEDLSDSSKVSNIQLDIRAKTPQCTWWDPVYGCIAWGCPETGGNDIPGSFKSDHNFDNKHLVSYDSTEMYYMRNQCLQVDLNNVYTPDDRPDGTATTVFCYYSGVDDNAII